MIKAIIIEDEPKAMEILSKMLLQLPIEVKVTAKLESVKDGLHYFMNEKEGDIIFSDIQLSDGLSFEIFQQAGVNIPIVFTTGYNRFLLTAFESNGIDYILKPVAKKCLLNAITKYQNLKEHFSHAQTRLLLHKLACTENKRTRMVARLENENVLIKMEDIVLFFSENKAVYLIDYLNRKYVVDKNLTELESDLDLHTFFRVNRQTILNLNYIKGYKSFEKVKLVIELNIPVMESKVIVSQETAPVFRNWMHNA